MKYLALFLFFLSYSCFADKLGMVDYYVIKTQAEPFQVYSKNRHTGIITDLVKEIFVDSPYSLNIKALPFKRMIKQLSTDKKNNWITYGAKNWGKVQSEYLLPTPVLNVMHVLVAGKRHQKEVNFKSLKGRTLILLYGFDYPGLEPQLASGEVKQLRVKSHKAAFDAIDKGRGDAFLDMKIRIDYHMNLLKKEKSEYFLVDMSHVIPKYSLYLAHSGQFNRTILAYAGKRLRELKEKGFVEQLKRRYFIHSLVDERSMKIVKID